MGEQKSSQTQKLIINTSFDLFYKNGYAITTIPDIMKVTCLSKGAFYHHFKNKQDIGERVISNIIKKRIYDGMISPLKDYKQQKTTALLTDIFTSRLIEFSEIKKRIYDGMISPLKDYKQQKTTALLTDIFTSRLIEFSEIEKQLGCPANNLINEVGQTEKGYRILLREIINLWKDSIIEVLNYGKSTNQIKEDTNAEAVATFLIVSFEGVRGIRKVYDTNEILEAYTSAIQTYISNLKK